MAVLVPAVAFASAVKLTTPFNKVNVPSPGIFTTPSASQDAGDEPGVMRQVTAVLNPAAELASPETPVRVVKATVPPGITDLV